MTDPTLLEIVRSKIDKTVKYVFLSKGQVIEFSFIDKSDGKDIICVPTQTGCKLGCKFCFLSDCPDLEVRNLDSEEIAFGVNYVIEDLGLLRKPNRNNILLVSYMGCGEPLYNLDGVIGSCIKIRNEHSPKYEVVRFAVSSLIPELGLMRKFTNLVKENNLRMKFHFSLHSPDAGIRHAIMPAAQGITASLILVDIFMTHTGNSAEIHYSLIKGVNDRDEDLESLIKLLSSGRIPIKFLVYNKKPSVNLKPSKDRRVEKFRRRLEAAGIPTEYYHPPGSDIGSSCGQFLMQYYQRYSKPKSQ